VFFSQKFIKILSIFFLLSFFVLLLTHPKECSTFASGGLLLWFEKMIPTLYPFMLLSQILLQTRIANFISYSLYPILGKIYSISLYGVFILIMGFLSGFPMGAILVSSLLKEKQISEKEAEFLLSFCNNLGPVFVLGILYQSCTLFSLPKTIFIIYGVPLLFGLILRYTVYKKESFPSFQNCPGAINYSLLHILEKKLNPCLLSIARLGGLMILFHTFQIYMVNRFYEVSITANAIFTLILEITGGIDKISKLPTLYPIVYCFLPMGGLCCLAQTAIIMKDHHFSMGLHILYKSIQCILATFFVLIWM